MLKNSILGISMLVMVVGISSCSGDDADDRNCESCELQGQTVELCDNGNGTYTLSAAGQSETFTEADLEGLTPAEYVDLICSFDDLVP